MNGTDANYSKAWEDLSKMELPKQNFHHEAIAVKDIHPKQTQILLNPFRIYFICHIVLRVCTEHGSDTAVLCTKFQNDLTTEQ